MKYTVIREFRDKYTKVIYKEGQVYETEDAKRGKYLQDRNLLGEQLDKQPEGDKGKKNLEKLKNKIASGETTINDARVEFNLPPVDDGDKLLALGGGWYELPDGTRVQGKVAATEALRGEGK